MTVREWVGDIQHELRSGNVQPSRQCEMLLTLTSLFGNILDEVTRAEAAYTAVLATCLDAEQKANRAKIRAELSPEFQERQIARNTEKLVTELIRSLKVVLKSTETEMGLSR